MEKYGQYRDKGSGIAPYFPIPSPASNALLTPYHIFLFFFRLPFLIFAWAVWLLLVQWTPAGGVLRKANLWCILGLPGVWWIDIRVDGVQRGSLGKSGRLPGPGTIIASSFTSPLDVLYLAAIFDPIFTQSFPSSRNVKALSLQSALAACFCLPPAPGETVALSSLVAANPGRVIVVFPEATTSNGRGVLRLSPSLLSAAKGTSIFPVSLRYTPADVVTPIPGWFEAVKFSWKLCSSQSHSIRVRIGFPLKMAQLQQQSAAVTDGQQSAATISDKDDTSSSSASSSREASRHRSRSDSGPNSPAAQTRTGYDTNFFDSFPAFTSTKDANGDHDDAPYYTASLGATERKILDTVAEALSRLGRAKTLGLGVEEKRQFVDAWLGRGTPAKKRK